MYAYIYDSFTNEAKYGKLLYKIEKRLTDLNLNGKIIRLGISKNVKVAVDDEIRQGTKTIVAVGNDRTVTQIINAIAGNKSDEHHLVTLGIIPIVEKGNDIARTFGIDSISSACEILLARRLQNFQLASINNGFFLFSAAMQAPETILEIDKNYLIHNQKPSAIQIKNIPAWPEDKLAEKKLKMVVRDEKGESLFFFQDLLVVNKNGLFITDNALEIKTPARIKISDEKIKIIVGKERTV
jgi:hypothetical protein